MSRVGAALAGVVAILSGCAYHNTIYNAERLYEEAEEHRRAGRDSIAEVRYRDVIRKTAEAYRGEPSGERAAETLFLLGRARLRIGELRAAWPAFEEAASLAGEPGLRLQISVYSGVVLARSGDQAGAAAVVNDALDGELMGHALAEAHLLRGGLLLSAGQTDLGSWDLDRAAEVDPGIRVEAGLVRLRWGVLHGDRAQAHVALGRLLSDADASERLDTIVALVATAAGRWDASTAASLLAGVDSSKWDRPARGRVRLERARLLHVAGDTAAASEQAWRVARGRGEAAAEARLSLAGWHLQRTGDLAAAQAVMSILLPAGENPRVADLLEAIDALDRYSGIGLDDEPLAWFAAAEVARDQLDAPVLARGLFLAYADTDPGDPWAPKALLAALDISSTEGDRAWLRGRLEAHRDSPYVLAARGGPAAGFEALEEELQVRLAEITGR